MGLAPPRASVIVPRPVETIPDRRLARALTIAYWVAVAVVIGAAILAAFHGLADWWLWGHDGYNGSAFSHAARNSIRFGIIEQAQYYTGLDPPGLGEVYTNHPLLLHFHLIALYELLGVSEWVSRLVPALYSVGVVLLLGSVSRRYFGRGPALLAMALWVLTPLHLIYANMVDHEQGSIFWCLLFVYWYLRWLDDGRRRHFVGTLVAVTFAVQFDWPGYYLAFFVALHALLHGVYRGRRPGRWWRREFGFVGWFSLTVLANFALFVGWIWVLRGGLDQLFSAFSQRSGEATNYLEVLASRSVDLYGVPLLVLLALWLVWASAQLARGTAHRAELIPWLFFFGQVLHSAVFQTAGAIHAYWTYHVGPALAIGGALVLWSAGVGLARVAKRSAAPARHVIVGFGGLVAVALGLWQLDYAVTQHRWGYDTGRASYHWDYQDEYYDTAWAAELGRRFSRDEVSYVIHGSAERRIHFIWYLDAPRRTRHHRVGFTAAEQRGEGGRRYVLLVDLERLGNAERTEVSELSKRFHTAVWDRRFVAFDASRPVDKGQAPSREAWIAEAREPDLLWRWLHDFRRPPLSWVPDPSPEAAWAALEAVRPGGPGELAGGDGGEAKRFICPPGMLASRLDVRAKRRGSRLVQAVRVGCRAPTAPGVAEAPTPRSWEQVDGPWVGGTATTLARVTTCSPDEIPVGIHGRAARLLDALGLMCARATALASGSGGPWRPRLGEPRRARSIGGKGGADFERVCPAGEAVVGLDVRAGALVDAVAIICAPFDEAFAEGLSTPAAPGARRDRP
ncbi:MAG: hypothetical protein CSA66_04890 [Proteobacteria bacterium]|nr:MAG: hypothetical protein CSA66_04890 [Pseudomonadota bacterium]